MADAGQLTPSDGRMLDEAEADALLDRIGIPRAPTVALDAAITRAPALPFPYPVAVKVLSAAIAHKSDVGGVVLNVRGWRSPARRHPADRGEHCRRRIACIVQPMVSGIGEVLVGYRVDRDVGPLIMVAAGGLHAEIFRDRSLRLAPVSLDEAHAMIAEVRALQDARRLSRQAGGRSRGARAGDRRALRPCRDRPRCSKPRSTR